MNYVQPKLAAILATALVTAKLFVGCSNQGEGERCDAYAGNEDCETGLTCQKIQQYYLCCPSGRAPTVSACIPGAMIQADSGADGTSPSTSTDATGGSPDTTVETPDAAGADDSSSDDATSDSASDATDSSEADATQD